MRRGSSPRPPSRARIGVALAGGGPLGGSYAIGALLALADSLVGIDLGALDVYVGVSSGAFVAAGLANHMSPAQMYALFIADSGDASLAPHMFTRPALAAFARRAAALPRQLARAAWRGSKHDASRRGLVRTLANAWPAGVFDASALERELARLLASRGRSNDFRALDAELLIVATRLESGEPVTFGDAGFDHVPISKAVQASAALPGLFAPVEIDGGRYVDGALSKTLHASIALERDVELLLCVNALVPLDSEAAARRHDSERDALADGGLPALVAQTVRTLLRSRLETSLRSCSRKFPRADVLLFEPQRGDVEMFYANILGYAHRKRLCAAAFADTRERLLRDARRMSRILARHGIAVDRNRLSDRSRTIDDALGDPRAAGTRPRGVREASRELARTLDHLERWIGMRRAGQVPV